MSFKTTGSNIREELPYPIKTVEVTDSEMAQLKVDFLSASDLTPYVVCNVEDVNNKSYYEWTGSDWINWFSDAGGGTIGGSFCIESSAVLTVPETTSDQNNFNPTGFTDGGGAVVKYLVILDASTNDVDVTGLIAPNPAKYVQVLFHNIGDKEFKFQDNDSGSIANNRFLFATGERKIKENETLTLFYNVAQNRWKELSRH